jgi:hypothetical protein
LGGSVFVAGLLTPLLVPLVAVSELATEWKAGLSGLLLLGIPELFMLAAVAVLGKEGFAYLKGKLFGMLGRVAPPDVVSRRRHRIGLLMLLAPLVIGWLAPYVGHLIAAYAENRLLVAVLGDLLLLGSLIVLGGDFWDRLRALFVHKQSAPRRI